MKDGLASQLGLHRQCKDALQVSYSWHLIQRKLLLMTRGHAHPAGGFCPGGSNGEVTPLKSELNFWRSSANATELFR